MLAQESLEHAIGAHERCRTPVEYLQARQWFIRVTDMHERLLEAGRRIEWHPAYMRARYESWVEHLRWDWCISRQRYFGVPIPAWRCDSCGATMLASPRQLPVDPRVSAPELPCACGSGACSPEPDVLDTWATSSCSPLILTGWARDDRERERAVTLPFSLRPQAHDIIRTWAFYSIVQSLAQTGDIPWSHVAISGHGLSEGRQKLSKSRATASDDRAASSPLELIERNSADALRYWATSARTGADSPFQPETLATARRLVTKLWNAGRFVEERIAQYEPTPAAPHLAPTDRWLLARLARTIAQVTAALDDFEHFAARTEIERFFWSDVCDNYLELAKARLYGGAEQSGDAARWVLHHTYLAVLKLFAPYLPYVTEALYQGIYASRGGVSSLHLTAWPEAQAEWANDDAERAGAVILELVGQVRRQKAAAGISVGAPLAILRATVPHWALPALTASQTDLRSASRAARIELAPCLQGAPEAVEVAIGRV